MFKKKRCVESDWFKGLKDVERFFNCHGMDKAIIQLSKSKGKVSKEYDQGIRDYLDYRATVLNKVGE